MSSLSGRVPALGILALAACVETRVHPSAVPDRFDTEQPTDSSDSETSDSSPVEVCNGLDDDDDGFVDEAFPDTDLDGVADCVDDTCAVSLPDSRTGLDEQTCNLVVPTSGLPGLAVAWANTEVKDCFQAAIADLDQDGTDEVVCGAYGITVLDALTGAVEWTQADADAEWPGIAVGDLDGDGTLEVVETHTEGIFEGGVRAFSADGSRLWAGGKGIGYGEGADGDVAIADLDGDGRVEVVTAFGVLDGITGDLEAQWGAWDYYASTARQPRLAIADIDGDGLQDLLSQGSRNEEGAELWSIHDWDGDPQMIVPIVVNGTDGFARIAWVYDSGVILTDIDGTEVMRAAAPFPLYPDIPDAWSLACSGDLDGDGASDIVSMNRDSIWAWELDGTVLWTSPSYDPGMYTGCTVFDFDGDGTYDVVYEDEGRVAVLDGATGATLVEDTDHHSGTYGDLVMPVDVDGDGQVELFAQGVIALAGAELYEGPPGAWQPGASVWSSPTWSGTAMRPDGSIPRYPARAWMEYGIFRGQPPNPVFGADLAVSITDSCVNSCGDGGVVHLAVSVWNRGPEGAPPDTPVTLYALDEFGQRTAIQMWTTGSLLWGGEAVAGVEVTLPIEQAAYGIVVVAGDPGDGSTWDTPDCDVSNDKANWTSPCAAP